MAGALGVLSPAAGARGRRRRMHHCGRGVHRAGHLLQRRHLRLGHLRAAGRRLLATGRLLHAGCRLLPAGLLVMYRRGSAGWRRAAPACNKAAPARRMSIAASWTPCHVSEGSADVPGPAASKGGLLWRLLLQRGRRRRHQRPRARGYRGPDRRFRGPAQEAFPLSAHVSQCDQIVPHEKRPVKLPRMSPNACAGSTRQNPSMRNGQVDDALPAPSRSDAARRSRSAAPRGRDSTSKRESWIRPCPRSCELRRSFRNRSVGVVRAKHALTRGEVTAARYAASSHVTVARPMLERGPIDAALDELGLKRESAIVVGGFASAITVARGSDLVATVPELHTETRRAGTHTFSLPVATPTFTCCR